MSNEDTVKTTSEPVGDHVQVYTETVWQEFLAKTNQARMASSVEYLVLKAWRDDGIPLRIVLRGLVDCKGKGRMLNYYDPAVREAFAQWKRTLAF